MTKTFSIVVAVYQNEESLPHTVPRLLELATLLPEYRLELVFVDDGSTDTSFEILLDFARSKPDTIKVVRLTRNFGQTPATQAGLRHVSGDVIGIISADLQEPHDKFVDMVRHWEDGALFVIGERTAREENKRHQFVSGIYWNFVRHFALPDFPKMGYDFCVLDRQVVDDVNAINETSSSIFVLIYWLGYRAVRVPIERKLREHGSSQWGMRRKIAFTIDTLIGFTQLPARMITIFGFVAAMMCIVYFFFLVGYWLAYDTAPAGWMTVIGLLTLIGAIVLFALGILSEYLKRILDEVRRRPPYVVEQVVWNVKAPSHAEVEAVKRAW